MTSSTCWLFTYFQNEHRGVRMAWSNDGFKWMPVNEGKPVLGIGIRDPFILKGTDGLYYLVYATGRHSIEIRSSSDLINWSEPWKIPVMENEPEVRNVWAPELFYDSRKDQVMLLWSSTIPGRFPETDGTGDDGYNHRCYYKTSSDLRNWSATRLLYDPGFNNIDATIVRNASRYMMVLKDETLTPARKFLRIAWADNAEGPYGPAGEPIAPVLAESTPARHNWIEGPAVVRIDDYWMLYFDHYFGNRYGAMRSRDGTTWEDVSAQLSMPQGARHGCVLEVPAQTLDRILKHWQEKGQATGQNF